MKKNRNKEEAAARRRRLDGRNLRMDASEIVAVASTSGAVTVKSSSDVTMWKAKKRPMKRTKNVRKKQAVAKAVSKTEQSFEKVSKKQNKISRTLSAKLLYD